jgi:hypothetical protein
MHRKVSKKDLKLPFSKLRSYQERGIPPLTPKPFSTFKWKKLKISFGSVLKKLLDFPINEFSE